MRAPFRPNHCRLERRFAKGEKVTLSPILLGLLRASASLWGIWLYRCPESGALKKYCLNNLQKAILQFTELNKYAKYTISVIFYPVPELKNPWSLITKIRKSTFQIAFQILLVLKFVLF
jgi:hypothetical protein